MRRILLALTTICSLAAVAQTLPNVAVGVIQSGSEQELVAEPRSTVVVDLTLLTSRFTAGEYARYAQRYLGVRAQLSDGVTIEIDNPSITLAPQDFLLTPPEVLPPTTTELPTAHTLTAERTSAKTLTPEDRAAACAERIFSNRAVSRDLISGDVGEGIFGAGLTSALAKFEREERELTALFLGREQRESRNHRFVVNLRGDAHRYMLCRLDKKYGITSVDDINGEAIYLQITPSQVADSTYVTLTGKDPAKRVYATPNYAQCDLYVGADVVKSVVLPLYEFGARTTVIYDRK